MRPLDLFVKPATRLWLRLRLNEIGPLLSLAVVSLAAYGFVAIADEVVEGDLTTLDRSIILALRNPADLSDPIGPRWFEEAARDLTALGGTTVLTMLTIVVLAYLLMSRKRHAAYLVVAAVGGGLLASTLLKMGFERPRPDLVPHGSYVYTASFPSGHAMLSAVTYLTLGALLARIEARRRIKALIIGTALVLTLLIGMSRVYLGVHWPSDVLAGWCGGAAWASLCWFIALQLQKRGQVEPPGHNGAAPTSVSLE